MEQTDFGLDGAVRRESRPTKTKKDPSTPASVEEWIEHLEAHILDRPKKAQDVAEAALTAHPAQPDLLHMGSLAALLGGAPGQCLQYQKRLRRRYVPGRGDELMKALALAHQRRLGAARKILRQEGCARCETAASYLPCMNELLYGWLNGWYQRIFEEPRKVRSTSRRPRTRIPSRTAT